MTKLTRERERDLCCLIVKQDYDMTRYDIRIQLHVQGDFDRRRNEKENMMRRHRSFKMKFIIDE
jgi:hypothetical protein